MLPRDIVFCRLDQASPDRRAHHCHIGGDRIGQRDALATGIECICRFGADEAVADHFLVVTAVEQRPGPLERETALWRQVHRQWLMTVRRWNVVVAVDTRQLLDEVCLDADIEPPGGRRDEPAFTGLFHGHAEARQDGDHPALVDIDTEQAPDAAVAQCDRFACEGEISGRCLDDRTGLSADDLEQELRGALDSPALQGGIDSTLEAMGRIRVHAILPRPARDRERREEGAFEQDIGRRFCDTALCTAHDAGHRQCPGVVGYDQSIFRKRNLFTIEQRKFLSGFCHPDLDAAIDFIQIEAVHRLAELQQDVVRDIDDGTETAYAATTQFFLHPERRVCRLVDTADDAAQVARAGIGGRQVDADTVIDSRLDIFHRRLHQLAAVERRDIACNADHAQAVAAIGRQVDLDQGVVQVQPVAKVCSDRGVRRQRHDAVGGIGKAQFGSRADHAGRLHTAQFRLLDFETTGQFRPDGCDRDAHAGSDIFRAADDLQRLIPAHIDGRHAELVGIRVLFLRQHLADDNTVEIGRSLLDTVDLEAGHAELMSQRIAVDIGINQLPEPGFTESHC